MQPRFYNTLSRQVENFHPIDANTIRMYVCGPTVYERPHLGNARSAVVYDVLYRLLTQLFGKDKVIYVRNVTDVDDKINDAAKQRNITIKALTQEIYQYFCDDMEALNCLKPSIEPKATEHIQEMISIINGLLDSNYAYTKDGHVYFDVSKYQNYTALSGRNIEDLIAGSRIEISDLKEAPEDFVLWKPADPEDDPSSIFASPWGKGRPGWHIECSAMSSKYLGFDFDIHGGGIDLIFPHHTNEIAQSCCYNKSSSYAKYWIHNGFLLVNGEKMSKSLGNFTTVKDALDKGTKGEVIRYVYLSTHYRKPLNWTDHSVLAATKALDGLYRILAQHDFQNNHESILDSEFLNILSDDLNTPRTLSYLHDLASMHNKELDKNKQHNIAGRLTACGQLIGLFKHNPNDWLRGNGHTKHTIDETEIENMLLKRAELKKLKKFKEADKIRDDLIEMEIGIQDTKDGKSTWYRL